MKESSMRRTRLPVARFQAVAAVWGALFFGLLPAGCGNSEGAIVAEYTGGTITRAEFQEFSAMVAADRALQPPDPHRHDEPGSPDDRDAILLRIADLRLAALEARRKKLGNATPIAGGPTARRLMLESFMIQVPALFKEPMYHLVEVQHFYRSNPSPAQSREWERRLQALAPSDVDAFVSLHTELTGFNATAGRQLPLCASCGTATHEFLVSAALGAPDGNFIRVPGVVAGGVWFVRLISRRTVPESKLAETLRPFYQKQAERLAAFRKAHPGEQGRGVPTEPAAIENSLAERIAFDRKEQAKRAEWSSFLGLTLGRIAERGLAWPASEAERSRVMSEVWEGDPIFQAAQDTARAKRWRSIREDELLASLLYEAEAHPARAREAEVRRLYSEHLKNLGGGPGLARAAEGLRADIRHRKQHVIIDRLRARLRADYRLKLHTDRIQ